jgi:hypothetical protein
MTRRALSISTYINQYLYDVAGTIHESLPQMRTEPSAPALTTHVGLAVATDSTPPSCAAVMAPTFLPSDTCHTASQGRIRTAHHVIRCK